MAGHEDTEVCACLRRVAMPLKARHNGRRLADDFDRITNEKDIEMTAFVDWLHYNDIVMAARGYRSVCLSVRGCIVA